jgi:hypothetical protein
VHKSPLARFALVSGANGALYATNSPFARRKLASGAKCSLVAAGTPALPTQPPLTFVGAAAAAAAPNYAARSA